MALVYADSFDHQDLNRYDAWTSGTGWESGRGGGSAIQSEIRGIGSGNIGSWHINDLGNSGNTLVIGLASWVDDWNNQDGGIYYMEQAGGGGTDWLRVGGGYGQWNLWVRGGVLVVSGGTPATGQWNWIEVKVTFATSGGYAEMRVNGTVIGTYSGDTGSVTPRAWRSPMGGSDGVRDGKVDDLVIMDGTGTTMNDFIGDSRVEFLQPTGDGNVIELTGSDGDQVNNYDNVNESLPNTADYNGSTGVGDTDLYTLTNLSTAATYTVYGVQVVGYVGKTPGVTRFGRLVALEGTSTSLGSSVGLSTAYAYEYIPLSVTPGGSTWTQNSFNNLQIGFRVST